MALTPKQEAFCMAYLETGNASEAYRLSYNAKNMKPDSINRVAKELIDNPKITSRLQELRKPIIERHNVTVDSLMKELEEARQLAIQTESPAPAVAATLGKAKLAGLDKQIVENTHRIIDDGSHEW